MVAERWPDQTNLPEEATAPHQASAPPESSPALGPFAELLGQPYQRLKVAVLRDLSRLPSPSWQLDEARGALSWLEPDDAGRLLAELRADGLVVPAAGGAYRLSDEAQLVVAVCAALAVPQIGRDRIVRVLGAAMRLADAAGADQGAAAKPFLAAVSVLESDFETLERLIDEGDESGLATAARLAGEHVADMRALLATEPGGDEPGMAGARAVAAAAAGRVGALATGVEEAFARRPGGRRPPPVATTAELRAVIVASGLPRLAAVVADQVRLPPALPPATAGGAFAALDELLERPPPVPVPLPEPRALQVESPDVVPDFVRVAGDVLIWLGGLGDQSLARWVVGGTWAEATARMAAAVEAWSRYGPAGDGSLAIDLDAIPEVEVIGRDEVGMLSHTTVAHVAPSPPEGDEAEPKPDAEEPAP